MVTWCWLDPSGSRWSRPNGSGWPGELHNGAKLPMQDATSIFMANNIHAYKIISTPLMLHIVFHICDTEWIMRFTFTCLFDNIWNCIYKHDVGRQLPLTYALLWDRLATHRLGETGHIRHKAWVLPAKWPSETGVRLYNQNLQNKYQKLAKQKK